MNQEAKNIREIIHILNIYTKAYDKGKPIISDNQWDNIYFKLKEIEEKTGIIYPDSPTQTINYEVVNNLKKVTHDHPMLSLDKTKDPKVIESFCFSHKNYWDWFAMFKMDGLSCRLTYINGKLIKGETRGNGEVGEDITHNVKVVSNIPLTIANDEIVVVDGEIICKYDDFEQFKNDYKNPRNFAAGSIRLLDASECARRNLTFVAWDLIKGYEDIDFNFHRLERLDDLGFTTVPRVGDAESINDAINILDKMRKEDVIYSQYPIDGYVFKFESKKFCDSLGRTEHHFNSAMAFKFYDDEYETRLKYINYDVSRNGVLTPVAVFDPIDVDGSIVERASLHNMSIMKEVLGETPYAGEKVWVIKSNMVIPQITRAEKKDYGDIVAAGGVTVGLGGDYGVLCPICGGLTSIKISESGVETLYCDNEECLGKLAQRIDHFCGKKGLDIKGISRKTIEKLIDWGWITELIDIYNLEQYRVEWESKPGFGKASVNKILDAINAEGRHPKLESFISALGIPLVGSTIAKTLIREFSTWQEFRDYIDTDDCFFDVFDGIGEEINNSLKDFDYTEADEIARMLTFKQSEVQNETASAAAIKDKVFVITGKLTSGQFKNRDELKVDIEAHGGKVTGSVSSKTNYLICNDKNSITGKSAEAKRLNISIITEDEYLKMRN